jgi:antitoxin ChpS
MMATAILRKLGGSVVMTVPRKLLALVDLDAGAEVKLSVESGRLVVSPQGRPKYRLADLLRASRGKKVRLTAEDRRWTNDGPIGKELI